MQLLFEESEEHGRHRGLGLLPGRVRRFEDGAAGAAHGLEHACARAASTRSSTASPDGAHVYFVHSYYCDAPDDVVIADSDYGRAFPAIVGRGTVLGMQFHPEKSQAVGLRLVGELRQERRRADGSPPEVGAPFGGGRVIVVPAIDLRGGRVVRLHQGRAEQETVYGDDPAGVARRFESEGARRIHLVDLDAAMNGPRQDAAIAEVVRAVRIPVEVGGGVRTLEDALRLREQGVERVIFGTAAVARPDVVQAALARFPEAVAIAIDARDGKVSVSGWTEATELDALELAATVEGWGARRVQFTDVRRDGTLAGPNLEAIEALCRRTRLRVTAAGGVSEAADLARLAALEPLGVDEAIVGKALYEGRVTLAAAHEAVAAVGRP